MSDSQDQSDGKSTGGFLDGEDNSGGDLSNALDDLLKEFENYQSDPEPIPTEEEISAMEKEEAAAGSPSHAPKQEDAVPSTSNQSDTHATHGDDSDPTRHDSEEDYDPGQILAKLSSSHSPEFPDHSMPRGQVGMVSRATITLNNPERFSWKSLVVESFFGMASIVEFFLSPGIWMKRVRNIDEWQPLHRIIRPAPANFPQAIKIYARHPLRIVHTVGLARPESSKDADWLVDVESNAQIGWGDTEDYDMVRARTSPSGRQSHILTGDTWAAICHYQSQAEMRVGRMIHSSIENIAGQHPHIFLPAGMTDWASDQELSRFLELDEWFASAQVKAVRPDRLSIFSTAAAIALGAVIAGHSFTQNFSAGQKFKRLVEEFENLPGITVVRAHQHGQSLKVSLLADPLSQSPTNPVKQLGLENRVELHVEPYCSLDPEIVIRRAWKNLTPPPTATLSLAGNRLIAIGSAPASWIDNATQVARLIPGIEEIDFFELALDWPSTAADAESLSPRQLLEAKIRTLTPATVLFKPFESVVAETQQEHLTQISHQLMAVSRAAHALNFSVLFTINGYSSVREYALNGMATSQLRAEAFRDFLTFRGIHPDSIQIKAMGKSLPSIETIPAYSAVLTIELKDSPSHPASATGSASPDHSVPAQNHGDAPVHH